MSADPSLENPIDTALYWIQAALLGTVATIVAVIAVASVGFLMLSGRLDLRRSAQVVIGCFIIFGASTIAQGIIGESNSLEGQQVSTAPPPPSSVPPPPPPNYPQVKGHPYDPYAGASVPP